ncbi:MAG TPA: SMC family ATPase, partial [Gaiellaceae bacterium]|nr:SMC family ATPase [Gaiellaceae bacterium]
MRPLELTVEGFRSYRERVTFDWRGRRLVGIVGPIGSGKSSILDAIAFALYGKTPAVEGATKSLIHQLCTESHVELRFSVDGQVWRAVRALKKKGASGHQLERLADDEPDAAILEHVTGDEPMKARVEQLLGMDFTAFCRSVLLAQNRFSEFLKATPTQRDAVLRGVFGFERLEDALRVAKSRLDRVELELSSLAKERERVLEARSSLEEARAVAATAQARLRQLGSAAEDVETITKEREAAEGEATDAAGRISTLEELAAALPSRDRVETVASAAAEAGARVDGARAEVEAAERARADRDAELADVTARLGDRERFRSFEHLVQLHERQLADVERIASTLADAEAATSVALASAEELRATHAAADGELRSAEGAATDAAAAVAGARDAVMEAKHAEMARELRGALVAGDPCPVCAQPVHTLPKAGPAPKVRSAEAALTKSERAEAKARERKEACAAALAAASAAVTAAEAAVAREREAVVAETERL